MSNRNVTARLTADNQRPLGLRKRNHQHHGINRRRLEPVPLIESLRLGGDRMNQNSAYADRLARDQSAQEGFTQKIAPKPKI